MKVSGFTILRQAVRLDYPFVESLRSLLPLVDEMVVSVGDGDDGTWEAVQAIGDAKVKAFRSTWDPAQRQGGLVLSEQTNLALTRCRSDWAVYLQADELLHEDDLDRLYASLRRHLNRRTEGLLFKYLHFIGSYDTVSDDWRVCYRRAVRAVKIGIGVESVGDACGFRVRRDHHMRGLIKANADAHIFHYGWCRPPARMLEKRKNLDRLYDDDDAHIADRYQVLERAPQHIFRDRGALRRFSGSHPRVMRERIAAQDWRFDRPRLARSPAWLRFAGAALRYPLSALRRDLATIAPVYISNLVWRASDFGQALAKRRSGAERSGDRDGPAPGSCGDG